MGNIRTALYNWLFARQNQGTFLLRTEDTDVLRSEKRFEKRLLEDLQWLGLTWDEGIECGGKVGPYRQSDRLDFYRKHAQNLWNANKAYYCFCSAEELQELRQRQLSNREVVRYSGKCRTVKAEEAAHRLLQKESAVLRLKVRQGKVGFRDMVFGSLQMDCDEIGDFVLLRSNGTATYNFACPIDDLSMSITHVIRGEGHISNTYRQILIYEAFDSKLPSFAHLSTVLGKDGSKLSKRYGAASVEKFRRQGYLPQALLNYLALLGWAPSEDEQEILTLEDLVSQFDLRRVIRSPAIFDRRKLNWVNRSHLKGLDRAHIVKLAIPYLRRQGWLPEALSEELISWVGDVIEAVFKYLYKMEDLITEVGLIFNFRPEEKLTHPQVQKILSQEEARNVIKDFYQRIQAHEGLDLLGYKKVLSDVKTATGQSGRDLFQPIRLAITGRLSGPELDKLVPILEKGKQLKLPVRVLGIEERVKAVLDQLR
tara:strand:+ start:42 stop:1487 length:1446 start_codon:yes stop_codon:yes gene_type:complete